MEIVNTTKRQQPHRDEKCQLKATHGSSKNQEEILVPKGLLQLAHKQHYTATCLLLYLYIFQQHKSKLWKGNKKYRRKEFLTGTKKCVKLPQRENTN